ncbi:MAG: ATPase [Muribaculaceae bacterium]|nr:ATPase [Muribaculaceae bacterium]
MRNILLADAGSSKTNWSFLNGETREYTRIQTIGINPAHEDISSIITTLYEVKDRIKNNVLSEIYYYGAGCANQFMSLPVEYALTKVFGAEKISVRSDLMGASIALFGDSDGIACILGTGSASALISKGEIKQQTPSLGYILGDEGSGVALGKSLLNSVFKKQLSCNLIHKFQDRYKLNVSELIEKVYRETKPARYIASFSPFLLENIEEEEIRILVIKEFENYFIKNILPYENFQNFNVGIVGSIAYNYQEILSQSAAKFGIKIEKILKDPMPALESFYLHKISE